MSAPFVERNRPEDLDSIVLPVDVKLRLKAFAINPEFQSCVFWGIPGTGKTTSALALVKEYMVRRGIYPPSTTLEQIRANNVPPIGGIFPPTLFVNSRAEGNIDFVKGRLTLFLQSATVSPLKFVVMDEADRATKDAMEALLPLIEQHSKTNRFIFTTNMDPLFGLGPAVVSRAGGCLYEFTKPSKEEVETHLKQLADKEGVHIENAVFDSIATEAKDVREAVGMLGAEIALVKAREEESKPKIEAVPFMAGAKIYYYASYNRPYSVIEIRDQIDGGRLVRPKGKIEFGEPFAIIQRNEPLDEKVIKSLELRQISADKIPPWWATAVRTEIPRFPQKAEKAAPKLEKEEIEEKKPEALPPFKPQEVRITEADEKALENDFKAELALRSIPLKTKDFDYLAAFRSYLRRAEGNKVSVKRFRENWLPNIISSIEEAFTNRTRIPGDEVERRIRRADAKFHVGDFVEYEGQLKKVLEVNLDSDTGRYAYRLEGIEEALDEDLLKPGNVPKSKWEVGDNTMHKEKGYFITDKTFNVETRRWEYRLSPIRVRTGAA